MLIKLTPIVGEKRVLVQERIIDVVCLNSEGRTQVYFNHKINADGNFLDITSSVLIVKETPEDIYEQQFKTCESSL